MCVLINIVVVDDAIQKCASGHEFNSGVRGGNEVILDLLADHPAQFVFVVFVVRKKFCTHSFG